LIKLGLGSEEKALKLIKLQQMFCSDVQSYYLNTFADTMLIVQARVNIRLGYSRKNALAYSPGNSYTAKK
jgi:hypothetical protein